MTSIGELIYLTFYHGWPPTSLVRTIPNSKKCGVFIARNAYAIWVSRIPRCVASNRVVSVVQSSLPSSRSHSDCPSTRGGKEVVNGNMAEINFALDLETEYILTGIQHSPIASQHLAPHLLIAS